LFCCRLDEARFDLARMSKLADLSDPTTVGREIEQLCSEVDVKYQGLMKGPGKYLLSAHNFAEYIMFRLLE
jgi:hypothetical protein